MEHYKNLQRIEGNDDVRRLAENQFFGHLFLFIFLGIDKILDENLNVSRQLRDFIFPEDYDFIQIRNACFAILEN